MTGFRHFVLVAAMTARVLAQDAAHAPAAHALNETTTRPWSAPVGHRQPRAADLPASIAAHQSITDPEDARVDQKIKGVCRGC